MFIISDRRVFNVLTKSFNGLSWSNHNFPPIIKNALQDCMTILGISQCHVKGGFPLECYTDDQGDENKAG